MRIAVPKDFLTDMKITAKPTAQHIFFPEKEEGKNECCKWYQNIDAGIPPTYSMYQFLALFRLVVVSWRRSICVWNGTYYNEKAKFISTDAIVPINKD